MELIKFETKMYEYISFLGLFYYHC